MSITVKFEQVSKQYHMGMTRKSLPTLIQENIRKLLGNGNKTATEKSFWAVKDVSFNLNRGESLALIGHNGAGKTTILKLLANITKPTYGKIECNGRMSALIELGSGFHPDLSGRENIYLNGTILGLKIKEIKRRFDEIVAFSEIERFLDTPVKRYSSGMAVRLGFSVAAFIDPDILLVDEVLAVGDASFRHKCMKRIKSLLDNGTSLIFVSHNLGLVRTICESALFIDHGQIVSSGRTKDVIESYERSLNQIRTEKQEMLQSEYASIDTDAEITGVQILDNLDKEVIELKSNQSTKIKIDYISYKLIESANVVIRVVRSDGLSCCFISSIHDGIYYSLEQGSGTISLIIDPIQLYTGRYYLAATLKVDDIGLSMGWSDWFDVIGSGLGESPDGVFEPQVHWFHNDP